MANGLNKTERIAINTIIMYIRMIVVMAISLYTSRIVLRALGIEDFGLYSVVGGVVGLFAFLRTSMEKATQRFLNVEMARVKGDINRIFCVNVTIHIFISFAILVFAESVGLWFLNSYIDIPQERELAANIVYQTVVFSLCITVISVPYSACIVAYEKMGVYAYISIFDSFLKLIIAYWVLVINHDHLIIYGLLMMMVSFVNYIFYFCFCRKNYAETQYHFIFDIKKFREVFSFLSWTILGQISILGVTNGTAILINVFHGVVANAALSIGNQVNHAVTNLSSNFQTAFNPQITKAYASGDYTYLRKLMFSTSKISFFLLFLFSLPLIINIDAILAFWLDVVPVYANVFCVLCIINGILNAVSAPLNFGIMATGRIKQFQIVTSSTYAIDLLIVLVLFKLGFPATTAMGVKVFFMSIIWFVRYWYAQKEINCLNTKVYIVNVLLPILFVSILTYALYWLLSCFASILWINVIVICLAVILIIFIGFSTQERAFITGMVRNKIKKK